MRFLHKLSQMLRGHQLDVQIIYVSSGVGDPSVPHSFVKYWDDVDQRWYRTHLRRIWGADGETVKLTRMQLWDYSI